MLEIAKIKDWLRAFYGKYDIVIDTVIKFVIAFVAMKLMNSRLGYFGLFENPFVILLISLLCSILPYGLSATVLSLCLLANVYKASLEMAIIIAAFLLIVALLYYSFHPGDAVVLILTPVLFALKIPYVLPLMLGLAGSLYSIIPMSCGIIIYNLVAFVKGNPAVVSMEKTSLTDIPGEFVKIISTLAKNKEMWLLIFVFAITAAVVYLVHKIPFMYSWYAAVGTGTLILLIAGFMLNISMSVPGIIIGAAVAAIYTFFVFDVDYKKTRRLQYEDEDYVYYVKAVPKVTVQYFEPETVKIKETPVPVPPSPSNELWKSAEVLKAANVNKTDEVRRTVERKTVERKTVEVKKTETVPTAKKKTSYKDSIKEYNSSNYYNDNRSKRTASVNNSNKNSNSNKSSSNKNNQNANVRKPDSKEMHEMLNDIEIYKK